MIETKEQKEKVICCYVVLNNKLDIDEQMAELKSLILADDAEVVGELVQVVKRYEKKYLMGTGKALELKELVQKNDATLIVFNNNLTGSQIEEIENITNCKVIDRTMLILDIFATRATSNEGKLQVELAQLKYSLPRLNALSGSSGRYGSGGIGMRGPGETKLEINRRIVENKIVAKEKELKKLESERELRRKKRAGSCKPLVAIVGYTNSGKSTLLNTITKANVLAKDMLFATLDTTSRELWLAPNKEIILVDTVGFVSNLPHELVDAFSSTLEETKFADLIINVVDISNPHYKEQEKVVNDVLASMGIDKTPIITVYNKSDLLKQCDMDNNLLYISAKNNKNIDLLKQKIIDILFAEEQD